jgi:hypothetical protein
VTLNSSNRCDRCHGIVHNATHKRHPIERLTEIHDESCPGLHRVKGRK